MAYKWMHQVHLARLESEVSDNNKTTVSRSGLAKQKKGRYCKIILMVLAMVLPGGPS